MRRRRSLTSGGKRHAHIGGFDLHANVAVPAGDRARLEHLARYVLHPPVAQDALERTPQGNVVLKIRRPWHDGTRAILFEPHELIARLCSIIPKPRSNLLLYHGILGPSARLRRAAVGAAKESNARETPPEAPPASPSAMATEPATRSASPSPETSADPSRSGQGVCRVLGPESDRSQGDVDVPESRSKPRPHTSWSTLMQRTFEIDVLACPGCGGRLRLLATIDDPNVVRKILSHLGLPTECPEALPARSPPRRDPELFCAFLGGSEMPIH
jgi:hypothetical protein